MLTVIHALNNGRLVVWPKTPSGRPSRAYYFSNEIDGYGDGECQASSDKAERLGDYVTGLDRPNYPIPAVPWPRLIQQAWLLHALLKD